ncbi:MAG: hypothetical protein WB992_04845 [Bryobacteraceae bacterium]
MTKQRPLVDERSFDLAEHFLPDGSDDAKWSLAGMIQQAIEDWFEDYSREDEPEEREPDSFSTLGLSERDFLPSEYLK